MQFVNQIQQIDHKPLSCSFKDILLEGERRFGFMSTFTFKCKMCNKKSVIETENYVRYDQNQHHCSIWYYK